MSTKKYVFNFIQNIRIFVEFCHEKRYILGVLSKSLGVTGIIVSEISLYSIYSISDQPISLYSINSIIVCPYGHWKFVLFSDLKRVAIKVIQRSAKKAWLFAKLQPGRSRRRINATEEAPFSRAI